MERIKLLFSGVGPQSKGAGTIEDSLIFSCVCLTEAPSGLVSSPPGEFIFSYGQLKICAQAGPSNQAPDRSQQGTSDQGEIPAEEDLGCCPVG